MITLFGIPNCDTVKKAWTFLAVHALAHDFVDFKKTALTKEQIEAWGLFFGELSVNKKGTTYRKLKEQYEALSAVEKPGFISSNPSLIKRPILVKDEQVL